MKHQFHIEPSGINLLQLLKFFNIAETGGHAKEIISDGIVLVNDEVEHRFRRKLAEGDVVKVEDIVIEVKSPKTKD